MKYRKDLPKDVELSEYLREKAGNRGYISIFLYGQTYYVPISKEIKKILGKYKIYKESSINCENPHIEEALRTITDAVYLQVRETVGCEVYEDLHRELSETFEALYEDHLRQKIDEKLKTKRIGDKQE
jgi:tRNA U54 and U55 pseudouridine synthase Pus10